MKIAVIPMDTGACGNYRLAWPAEAVQAARPDWEVRVYSPHEVAVATWKGDLLTEGLDAEGLDLVVVQRLGEQNKYAFVTGMQRRGVAVVTDIDDALWCLEKDNGAYAAWNSRTSRTHWSWMDKASRVADLTTVTTKGLEKRYAAHGRVEVIPNGLPEHAYLPAPSRPPGGSVVVGWSGLRKSHPHDLEVMGGALSKVLAEDPDVMVKIVGDTEWAAGVLGVPADRLIDAGHVPLDRYHEALIDTDVGLVPLQDTLFNRCKSSLKALEYSAVGAYVLASATPANRELQRHVGTVDVVRDGEEEWYQGLRTAIHTMRVMPQKVARSAVRQAQSRAINGRAHEWVSAWERAVARRKALDS